MSNTNSLIRKQAHRADAPSRGAAERGPHLDALQLQSNALLLLEGPVLSFRQLVGQGHVLEFQMLQEACLGHLSNLQRESHQVESC